MAKENGKDITVSVNDAPVGCARTGSFNLTTSTLDVTTKCSKDSETGILFSETQPNIISGEITIDALQPVVTSGGAPDELAAKELAAMQLGQVLADVSWVNDAGTFAFYSKAWVTSLSINAPHDNVVDYSATLSLTGKISQTPLS